MNKFFIIFAILVLCYQTTFQEMIEEAVSETSQSPSDANNGNISEIEYPTGIKALQSLMIFNSKYKIIYPGSSKPSNIKGSQIIKVISLANFKEIHLDENNTVYVGAGISFKELADNLNQNDKSLKNLPSNGGLNVVHSVITGVLGTGYHEGLIANAVEELLMIHTDGSMRHYSQRDPEYKSVLLGMGYLGVIVGVRLKVYPHFTVLKCVYKNLTWFHFTRFFNYMFYGRDFGWLVYDIQKEHFPLLEFFYKDDGGLRKKGKPYLFDESSNPNFKVIRV